MPSGQLVSVLAHLRRLIGRPPTDTADQILLDRFVTLRDEAAYGELLERYGALVLNVCRRVLNNVHDAEDAFQATFLVLARKAPSIRESKCLAGWLHGVAYRIALKAQTGTSRRRAHERQAAKMHPIESSRPGAWEDLGPVLDEELKSLPAKYRLPILLRYFQNLTNEEAALSLGCPPGTLSWRLAQGLEMLRKRLARRGMTFSAAFPALLAENACLAAVPESLRDGTLQNVLVFVAGHAAASTAPFLLAQQALATLALARAQAIALRVLLIALLVFGVGLIGSAAWHARNTAQTDLPAPPLGKPFPDDPLPDGAFVRLGTTSFRQGGPVLSLAVSPDGKRLASSGRNSKTIVWNLETGALLREFSSDDHTACSFSADSKQLLLMKLGEVVLHDVESGKVLVSYRDPTGQTAGAALSADGATLAVACNPEHGEKVRTVKLLDVATGKEQAVVGTQPEGTGSRAPESFLVRFSLDGKKLSTVSQRPGLVRQWDAATGEQLAELSFPGELHLLALAPDADTLAVQANRVDFVQGQPVYAPIEFWSLSKQQRLGTVDRPGRPVSWAFAPDGKTFALSTETQQDSNQRIEDVAFWEVATGKKVRDFPLSEKEIITLRMAFAPDAKTLITGGMAGTIFCWNVATAQPLLHNDQHSQLLALAFSPDGKSVATSEQDGRQFSIRLWDSATGRQRAQFANSDWYTWKLTFDPQGKHLITDGGIFWDVVTGQERLRLEKPAPIQSRLVYPVLSPDGQSLAMCRDGELILWDMNRKTQTRTIKADHVSRPLAFSPDGQYLAAAIVPPARMQPLSGVKNRQAVDQQRNPALAIWEAATGRLVREFEVQDSITAIVFSPDGQTIYAGTFGRIIRWDAVTGKPLAAIRRNWNIATELALSRQSTLLAFGDGDEVVLWDLQADRQFARLKGHVGRVERLAFSPDGRRLATGSTDGTVLIWKTGNSRQD